MRPPPVREPRAEPPAPVDESQPPESSDNAHADELRPRLEAVIPKDPDGPARDWRDFNEEEKVAQTRLEQATRTRRPARPSPDRNSK